jgi:hypothetical protein
MEYLNPVEHLFGAFAYTLPSLIIGFAVVYFTYVKPAKFSQKNVFIGLLITWTIFALIVFLFGENFLGDIVYLLVPIIIGYIVFYLLRNRVQRQTQSAS